jgi:hypothetical protein
MKAHWGLLLHELGNARNSLTAAALLTLVLLALLHVFGGTPTDSATALPFLWSFCALQFAADSFATDLASGRLATRATLPVCARALWVAKLSGFGASLALVCSLGIALELAWQAAFGRPFYCREFLAALPPWGSSFAVLGLIGASGILCSLLVESALTAMLLTGLVLAGLWGLLLAFDESVKLTGESSWTRHPEASAVAFIALFLVVGHVAFTRAQRRLGSAAVRVRMVLVGALVMTVGLAGTGAAASWHWSRFGLEDPHVQIHPPLASPDGRFLAFVAEPQQRGGRDERLHSVWVLELETGARHLIAAPGQIARDFHTGRSAWTEEDGLEVWAEKAWSWELWTWEWNADALCVRADGGELREEALGDRSSLIHGKLPEWVEVVERRAKNSRTRSVRIAWKDTHFERTFEGNFLATHIQRAIMPSPTPGRLFVLRDGVLSRLDLATGDERALVTDCEHFMDVSPDGRAFLVKTKTHTHVLSALDGSTLHEPWGRKECLPRWIEGDDASHELRLLPFGPVTSVHVLDLEHDRELEIEALGWNAFARVRDRGYAAVDNQGDLVWLDREGQLVKVLIDRGERRN